MTTARTTRRPRGEPRRLLLDAARELFARQDYRSTTTREIAESPGVAEHLLFRNFGSKAALFREACVVPLTSFVDDFAVTWRSLDPHESDEEEIAAEFVRPAVRLVRREPRSRAHVVGVGVHERRRADRSRHRRHQPRALGVLSRIGAEGMDIKGLRSARADLVAQSTVAMIAGMAAFRSSFFSSRRPSRKAIVEELTQAVLHGFLHRDH